MAGIGLVQDLIDVYSLEVVQAYMGHIQVGNHRLRHHRALGCSQAGSFAAEVRYVH